ncbi:MAG: zinc ribbon domain-containing protein [Anaerolineae bacterium]
MSIGVIMIGLAMLIITVPVLAGPFRKKERGTPKAARVTTENQYDATLLALRDLEFDHQLGVVAEDDYVGLRSQLMAQAAGTLAQKPDDLDAQIEAAVQARRQHKQNGSGVPSGIPCAACGAVLSPDAKFCSMCGTAVSTTTCPTCHQPHDPEDRFCTGCGAELAIIGDR